MLSGTQKGPSYTSMLYWMQSINLPWKCRVCPLSLNHKGIILTCLLPLSSSFLAVLKAYSAVSDMVSQSYLQRVFRVSFLTTRLLWAQDGSFHILERMKEAGLQPDTRAYNVILSG